MCVCVCALPSRTPGVTYDDEGLDDISRIKRGATGHVFDDDDDDGEEYDDRAGGYSDDEDRSRRLMGAKVRPHRVPCVE